MCLCTFSSAYLLRKKACHPKYDLSSWSTETRRLIIWKCLLICGAVTVPSSITAHVSVVSNLVTHTSKYRHWSLTALTSSPDFLDCTVLTAKLLFTYCLQLSTKWLTVPLATHLLSTALNWAGQWDNFSATFMEVSHVRKILASFRENFVFVASGTAYLVICRKIIKIIVLINIKTIFFILLHYQENFLLW